MTYDDLLVVASEYLTGEYTMEDLAAKHGVSKATIIRGLSGKQQVRLPSDMQKDVDDLKQRVWLASKSTSGNLGHTKYSDEEVVSKAIRLVTEDKTLRELSEDNEGKKSTLYVNFSKERLGSELYGIVREQYRANKAKSKSNSTDVESIFDTSSDTLESKGNSLKK